MPTPIETITSLLQAERWMGEDMQRAFDSRVVDYAIKHGINPVAAINGPAFSIPKQDLAKLREGLNLS
jgi:hypothetical protein